METRSEKDRVRPIHVPAGHLRGAQAQRLFTFFGS